MQTIDGNDSKMFTVLHCCQCDKKLGWINFPTSRIILCDTCIHNTSRVVCFPCEITHVHKVTEIDKETINIEKFEERDLNIGDLENLNL